MTPLTPDHHFYMDQGTYARVRLVLMGVGRKLVEPGGCSAADDVMFLRYHELRVISANASAFDATALVKQRRREREKRRMPSVRALWAGTITDWSLHEEPYKQGCGIGPASTSDRRTRAKQPAGTLRGLGASAGVIEGMARVVDSAEQFDQVKKGEVLVCKMTSPSWVVLFTKIGGAGDRFGRGAVAPRRRVARVRHSGGRRHADRHAEDQNRAACPAQRRSGARRDPWLTRYLFFDEAPAQSRLIAGGKGASLSRMAGAGLPVPPGFVISADAFHGISRILRRALC